MNELHELFSRARDNCAPCAARTHPTDKPFAPVQELVPCCEIETYSRAMGDITYAKDAKAVHGRKNEMVEAFKTWEGRNEYELACKYRAESASGATFSSNCGMFETGAHYGNPGILNQSFTFCLIPRASKKICHKTAV